MRNIFIAEGLRTPIGSMGKSLKTVSAVKLAGVVIDSLIKKSGIEKSSIDEVILGNTVSAGLGQNPARQAAVAGGLPPEIPSFTVNKVCGSGLKSIILASQAISCGDAGIIIAGGTENVSQCPYLFSRNKKLTDIQSKDDINDSLIGDGLWCNLNNSHMGDIAEYTAEENNISRFEQDEYAFRSQEKAIKAAEEGLFSEEIVPVQVGEDSVFDSDEKPRKNLTIERLSRLPSAFKSGGTITAGNSPAPADGAAALIVASEEALKKNNIKPSARILGYTSIAVDPKLVFASSDIAIKKCLKVSSLDMSDIDLFEINEAFAVQMIMTIKKTGLDTNCLNVHGGTIALGHPLGASGARGLITLINSLKVQNKKIGLTSVCLGGGCTVAMAIQLL